MLRLLNSPLRWLKPDEDRVMDVEALKRTWADVVAVGDDAPLYFYSHLFVGHPELRDMFPVSMANQRDKLFAAIGHIVSNVDRLEEVTGFIQQLGRDHRRFAVISEHYSAVGASLLATLKRFLGAEWTESVAADWSAAYGLIAKVMVVAAEDAADDSPPWWDASVVSVDRRGMDVTVLQLQMETAMDYRAGQSMAMEMGRLPRLWRYVTPANAPRDDRTLELHVQLVPGGQFSSTAVRKLAPGDTVRLGAAMGDQLTVPADTRDLLLVAGGTGLAPLIAGLDQVRRQWESTGTGRQVTLFHGARLPWNLYEHEKLTNLALQPWFDYHPVVSDDPSYPGLQGLVGSTAAGHRSWAGRLAMVCGSPGMVSHTVAELRASGVSGTDIRYETFATLEENSSALAEVNEIR
ncbi:globin domain-containing protein [Agromyces laixinhei]|uniref:globin domain-containing protein n=1 Tax=Agromyces laixinhei TaxID=2585717 RepID=UPI0018DBC1EB|nr:globin domain-containing protein [Agromyces laixinhei]